MSFYSDIESKRKVWSPMYPTGKASVLDENVDFLSRCLALRKLELPVKEFILEGLSRSEVQALGEEAVNTLMRNTEDEERHDIALNNCVSIFTDYQPQHEKTVDEFLVKLREHPEHPILKTLILEQSLFFLILPLFREIGYDVLRRSSIDISADEANHVQSHRYICKALGRKLPQSLDKLRKEIVEWLVEPFKTQSIKGREFSSASLRKTSDSLMYRGVAKELEFSKSANVNAFFETENSRLQYYA